MVTPALHAVWSFHAREREMERVDLGVTLPDIGSIVRPFFLGIREDDRESWMLQTKNAYLYGTIFQAPEYDVFLIKTVVARPTTVGRAPRGTAMYQLDKIYEQGEEGDEGRQWEGYTYNPTTDRRELYIGSRPESQCDRVLSASA